MLLQAGSSGRGRDFAEREREYLERRDAVAVLTLNRPEALNALSLEMLDDLEQMLQEADADPTLRAVVLTGAGEKAFCVGADINEWAALPPLDMWRRWIRRGHQVFDQWA